VTQLVNAKSSGVTITSDAYSFDAVGNPVGMTEANGDVLTWTYDSLNRLAREQRSGDNAFDMTYSYDPVANRATKVAAGATTTYTYDAASELTLEEAAGALTTYSYDQNGNTLAWNAGGSRTTLTWGYEDEVLTVLPSAGGTVTMTYDGDHMRRKREEGASAAKYVWDGAQVLLDTDAGDATVARYTLAPFGYGDLVSQRRSGATSLYHFDSLGSTRALTDASEAITDTYLYEAWGAVRATAGETPNPWRYMGNLGCAREESVSGYYLRRRHYRAEVGRFLTARRPLGGGEQGEASMTEVGRPLGRGYGAPPPTTLASWAQGLGDYPWAPPGLGEEPHEHPRGRTGCDLTTGKPWTKVDPNVERCLRDIVQQHENVHARSLSE
jgi:YD repeat-containing protein